MDPVLRRRLRAAADEKGFLTFDRFVEIALYEPGRGFYDRGGTPLGRAGDFYTAAHVHGLYGATLAAHFREIRQSEGAPARFSLVEVGPGDGTLASDLRSSLSPGNSRGPDWDYVLVERSATLRRAIEARIGPSRRGEIPWRSHPSLAAVGPVRGVVLANELLDAFPFRRFQRLGNGWTELVLNVPAEGAIRNEPHTWETLALRSGLPAGAPEGTVLEVSLSAEAWIRELADHLVGGRAVLVDYGAEEEALLSRGAAGTLEAIREHRSVDPLFQPGSADISAWVNFTRIRRAARSAGLRETFYGPLSEALLRWGLDEIRAEWEVRVDSVEAVKIRLAQKSFLLGFGTFKVLELAPSAGSA